MSQDSKQNLPSGSIEKATTTLESVGLSKDKLALLIPLMVSTFVILARESTNAALLDFTQPHEPLVLLAVFIELLAASTIQLHMLDDWQNQLVDFFRNRRVSSPTR